MGGRPPLEIGTYGDIYTKQLGPGKWMARCQYRGADGKTRPVKRHSTTETKAKAALRAAVSKQGATATSGTINGTTRLKTLAELWFKVQDRRVANGDRAATGLDQYRQKYSAYIKDQIGDLMLHECTVSRMNTFLSELADRLPQTAALCRAILSGMLGYAVRSGDALATNPLRDTEPVGKRSKKPKKALDVPKAQGLVPALEADPQACALDLPDLAAMLMATGARPGELTGLHWEDIDLEAGTARIAWHVVRRTGMGVLRTPGRKTGEGEVLVLKLPQWAVDRLRARRRRRPFEAIVFPHPSRGGYQDCHDVSRGIRKVRDRIGYPGLTCKVIGRNTVVTILVNSGASRREVADQVGHSDTSSQEAYLVPGVSTDRQAELLAVLGTPLTGTG